MFIRNEVDLTSPTLRVGLSNSFTRRRRTGLRPLFGWTLHVAGKGKNWKRARCNPSIKLWAPAFGRDGGFVANVPCLRCFPKEKR